MIVQYQTILLMCDTPGCNEQTLVSFESLDFCEEMVKSIKWSLESFPGEKNWDNTTIIACPRCSKLDPSERSLKKEHDCVFVRTTKAGKPSPLGKVLQCIFCDKIK